MNNHRKVLFAPSLLAADFSNLPAAIALTQQHQAPWLHFDVMDGHFVPAITYGAQFISSLRDKSDAFFDVHLMVTNPAQHFASMAAAGANLITFHIEAAPHAHGLIQEIHALGLKAGIAINPATPVWQIQELLPDLDLVLVMSVNPGRGGQSLIPKTLEKVALLAQLKQEHNYTYVIEMDGGVNHVTLASCKEAGAETLVMGSAFFQNPKLDALLQELRA